MGITDLPGIGTCGHVLKIKMFGRTNIQHVNQGAHLASNECDIPLKNSILNNTLHFDFVFIIYLPTGTSKNTVDEPL